MKPTSNQGKRSKNSVQGKSKSGEIRIIGGAWRGRKLKVHDKEGLRPTTDRLKETLFNWLMTDIRDAVVLDCFAGAGSLSFEAASRHAKQVVAIEKDPQAAKQLLDNNKLLKSQGQVTVSTGDFFTVSQKLHQPFDLIFIDPPFFNGFIEKVIPHLLTCNLIKTDGILYIEQEANSQFDLMKSEWSNHFSPLKSKTAGQVRASLYRYEGAV